MTIRIHSYRSTGPFWGFFFALPEPRKMDGCANTVPEPWIDAVLSGKYRENGPKEGGGIFFLGDLHDNIAICVVIVLAASGCPILTLP